MRFILAAAMVTFIAPAVLACNTNSTCTVAGVTYICDTCSGTGPSCPYSTGADVCPGHCVGGSNNGAVCTQVSDCSGGTCVYNGDGNLTRCFGSENDNITNSGTNEVICSGAGNDTVNLFYATKVNAGSGDDFVQQFYSGFANNDVIEGGTGKDTLDGKDGADTIYGNTSGSFTGDDDNIIYGGPGNDFLVGANGDDRIFGGDGNDIILGQAGRDLLKGGGGDDTIVSEFYSSTPNDVLGSLLCGEGGDDELVANGPGHQCMDGGPNQTVSGGDPDDCVYINTPDDSDAYDVATAVNCAHAVKTSTGGTLLTRTPSCGCE